MGSPQSPTFGRKPLDSSMDSPTENHIHKQEIATNTKFFILLAMICLLVCSNIALLIYAHRQKQVLQQWQLEKIERQQNLQKQAWDEIARWQAELACYENLEEAMELLRNQQSQAALAKLALLDLKQFPILLYLRARLYHQFSQNQKALHDITAYLTSVPGTIQGRLWKVQLQIELGQPQEAIAELELFLQEQPDCQPAKELLQKLTQKP